MDIAETLEHWRRTFPGVKLKCDVCANAEAILVSENLHDGANMCIKCATTFKTRFQPSARKGLCQYCDENPREEVLYHPDVGVNCCEECSCKMIETLAPHLRYVEYSKVICNDDGEPRITEYRQLLGAEPYDPRPLIAAAGDEAAEELKLKFSAKDRPAIEYLVEHEFYEEFDCRSQTLHAWIQLGGAGDDDKFAGGCAVECYLLVDVADPQMRVALVSTGLHQLEYNTVQIAFSTLRECLEEFTQFSRTRPSKAEMSKYLELSDEERDGQFKDPPYPTRNFAMHVYYTH